MTSSYNYASHCYEVKEKGYKIMCFEVSEFESNKDYYYNYFTKHKEKVDDSYFDKLNERRDKENKAIGLLISFKLNSIKGS